MWLSSQKTLLSSSTHTASYAQSPTTFKNHFGLSSHPKNRYRCLSRPFFQASTRPELRHATLDARVAALIKQHKAAGRDEKKQKTFLDDDDLPKAKSRAPLSKDEASVVAERAAHAASSALRAKCASEVLAGADVVVATCVGARPRPRYPEYFGYILGGRFGVF